MKINIAIDGPSAAGKSTIADLLAKKLGYIHLDTGAMYRCVALKAKRMGIALDDEKNLCSMLSRTDIAMTPEGTVFLDGEDVSSRIREEDISMAGYAIGQSGDAADFLAHNTKTVEGVLACRVVYEEAKKQHISMPITDQIYAVLYEGKSASAAISELMNRDLKSEETH